MWSNFRILYIFYFALAAAVPSTPYQNSKTEHGILSIERNWMKIERPVIHKKAKHAVGHLLEQNDQTSYPLQQSTKLKETRLEKQSENLENSNENRSDTSLHRMAGKKINENKNDTRKFTSSSWNRNSVYPEIKMTTKPYSYKTGIPQSKILTVVGKTFSKPSVKGLSYKTTDGPTKSNTHEMRRTINITTNAIKTKIPVEKERIENSDETHDKKNSKTGNDTGQQTTMGNFEGDEIDINEEQQTQSLGNHTNENNSSQGNNQSMTQNPVHFNFNSNNHQRTKGSPSSVRETIVLNNHTEITVYPTETVISEGRNVVTQFVRTTVSNANQREKTSTLEIITQPKNTETEQHVTSLMTPVISNSEQSVSTRNEKAITFHENIHKASTEAWKDLDKRKTDQLTTIRLTQTKDKSLRWNDSSKQGVGSTRKETVRMVHTTTPSFAPRHTTYYDSSSVLAATLGGAFLGGLLVFAMFYCKKRITRYIRGDYRPVPMEYDFELNPRLKSP